MTRCFRRRARRPCIGSTEIQGPREIRLLPGNDHGLTRHSTEVEKMIFEFAAKTLGFEKLLDQSSDQAGEDLIESRDERIREMVEGHDLEGDERLQ